MDIYLQSFMHNHTGAIISISHIHRFNPDCLCGNICICLSTASSEQWKTAPGLYRIPQCFCFLHPKKQKKKPSTQPQHLLLGTKHINMPCLAIVNVPFIWENTCHTMCYKRKPQDMDISYCIATMRMFVWRQCECNYAITVWSEKILCENSTTMFTRRVDVGQVKERPQKSPPLLKLSGWSMKTIMF